MADTTDQDVDLTLTYTGQGEAPDGDQGEGRSLLGARIGHIRIVRRLGQGGMGEVFEGFDEKLHRRVAVKAIRSTHRLRSRARARFLQEARMLSAQDHPNICRVHDYIEEANTDLLVLELIEGDTLSSLIPSQLPHADRLQIALQISAALIAAHHSGVIHRDLKPDNVMVVRAGAGARLQVKVLDFGLAGTAGGASDEHEDRPDPETPESAAADRTLAVDDESATLAQPTVADNETLEGLAGRSLFEETALTRHGSVMGTLLYMSPEQARGEPLSTATDMYSFGLLLQELFSGKPPYDTSLTQNEVWELARSGGSADVAGTSRDIANLVRLLKQPEPSRRPTAYEASSALRRIKEKPRRILRNVLASAVVLAAALGTTKYVVDLERERTAAENARREAEEVVAFLSTTLRSVDPSREGGDRDVTVRQVLDVASLRIETDFGDRPLIRARLQDTMGVAYRELGVYDRAEPLLKQSLTTRRGLLALGHPDLTSSIESFAFFLDKTASYDQAQVLFEEALAAREAESPPNPARIAVPLSGVAGLLFQTGDYEHAKPLYERVQSLLSETLTEEEVDADPVTSNLGSVMLWMDDLEGARPLLERSLLARERSLGPDHLRVSDILNLLAILNSKSGDHVTAQGYLERALEIRERVLGPDHDGVSEIVNNLAIEYRANGDLERAKAFYERGLAANQLALGPDHLFVGTIRHNFGNLLVDLGAYDEGLAHFQGAAAIYESHVPPDHILVTMNLTSWENVLRLQGRDAEADDVKVRQPVASQANVAGPEDTDG